jgi:hypothetical protein
VPSPVGHTLAAIAAGWAIAGPPSNQRWAGRTLLLAVVANAPDLDLLVGRHSGETHSIGAAVIVATALAAVRYPVAPTRLLTWCVVLVAWLTHPVLDALAIDTSAPHGVMLFWPFSREHMQTGWGVFDAIYRHWWEDTFLPHNARAIAREVLVLAPLTALVLWLRSGKRRTAGVSSGTRRS